MEKFSKWLDAGTGIQPFLPPRAAAGGGGLRSAGRIVKYVLVGPLLAVLRLVLGVIVLVWLLTFSTIGNAIPVTAVRRGFLRYIYGLGGRVLLALLGFWWIPTSWATIRRGRGNPETAKGLPGSGLRSGDLIVANHTSYVDVLYLAFRFAPQFTEVVRVKPAGSGRPEYRLRPISFGAALRQSVSAPALDVAANAADVYTVDALLARAATQGNGPVVVFPEATTSNGRSILAPTPILAGWTPRHWTVMIVGLRYVYEDFAPTYTAGSVAWHVAGLACQFANTLEVRYVSPSEASVLVDGETDFAGHAATVLAQVLRIRRVRLGVDDKTAFLDYFNTQRGSRTRSKAD